MPPLLPQRQHLVKTWHLYFSEWWFPLLVYCLRRLTQMASFSEFLNACAVVVSMKALSGRLADRHYQLLHWDRAPFSIALECPQPQSDIGHVQVHHSVEGLYTPLLRTSGNPLRLPVGRSPFCPSENDQGRIKPRVAWVLSSQHCSFQSTQVIALLRPTYPQFLVCARWTGQYPLTSGRYTKLGM